MTPETAFKTIQACVNYITENYNLGGYSATIVLADGEYGSSEEYSTLSLKSYSGSSPIIITGNAADYSKVVINHHVELGSSVEYQLRNLTIRTVIPSTNLTNYGLLYISSGTVQGYNICFDITKVENSANNSIRYIVQVQSYGLFRVYASNNPSLKSGIYIKANEEQEYKVNLFILNSGKLLFTADITFLSSLNNPNGTFLNASELSTASFGNSVFSDPGRPCLVTVPSGKSVTGKRYSVNFNSTCNVANRGAEFFPGSIAGTTSYGGQYS